MGDRRGALDPEIEAELGRIAGRHELPEAAVAELRDWLSTLFTPTQLQPPEDSETVLGGAFLGAPDLPLSERRFEFVGDLGRGAMGEVYRVWDRGLRRSLALKTLRPDRAGVDGMIARFIAEAQLTAQLRHPAIVPVHDLGRLPDGRLYYTMREIRGRTLGERVSALHRARPASDGWTLQRLLAAFASACDAVAHAHARGVVHRDLKPSNIMIGEFDEVCVLDWGVAKLVGAETDPVETDRGDGTATLLGEVVGTPAYMAPEQAYGWNDRVDARADVYALGAILYEILSGRPPYVPLPGRPVLAQVLEGPPQALPEGASPPLDALCGSSMARDRGERPADAGAFAQRLRQALAGEDLG